MPTIRLRPEPDIAFHCHHRRQQPVPAAAASESVRSHHRGTMASPF